MTSAGELTPVVVCVLGVQNIGPVGKRAHEANRIPVAGRYAEPSLIFDVMRQVRQRVTLRLPAIVGDGFIASRERNRLEAEEANLLRIVERELNNASDLLVVNAV